MILFFVLIIGLFFILISRKYNKQVQGIKKSQGIQDGKLTYSDLNKSGKTLFSKRYQIVGKPDYIIKKDGRLIPVEFKTGNFDSPQKNHVYQIAAYCQLVEDSFGGFVPYGMLVYNNDHSFRISFDPRLRFDLENTISSMRNDMRKNEVFRNHSDSFRCRSCSMRVFCDKKLM